MPNRLAGETSPYLLQHADNPVDWFPWGPEALARARDLDRPILLSVGYSACHWCHVMERESFDDPSTAAVMNERFVSVKVDREERPDIDQIYMSAVQAMTGQGGWPMTVFLTPDGKPFWGGTYFPDEPRHGMPSFRQVLDAIHAAWTDKRDGVLEQSEQVTAHLDAGVRAAARAGRAGPEVLDAAARAMLEHLDTEWGGFGGAPKFPQPMNLEFLLRAHLRGVPGALAAVTTTLDRMARGGIFDQLGGGFHRYSVDRLWLVPHFEKMLYDNAQLLRLYARAWQVTRSPLYERTAIATAEWLLREMRTPEGAFASSLDADSDGTEGAFYVWPYDELIAAAGEDMPVAVAAYAAAGTGNWEGVNVLWHPDPDEEVVERIGMEPAAFEAALARVRTSLLAARDHRTRPATDDKVLAAWNGMTIAALAEAGRIFSRTDLVEAAARAAGWILEAMIVDGRLRRAWRDGRGGGPAFLDDHAAMADATLTLYETTFEPRWWSATESLVRRIRELFADPDGGFFDTGHDADPTIIRPKDVFDNAVPSGNAAASAVLLRVAALTGDTALAEEALAFPRSIGAAAARAPLGFGSSLCALARGLHPGTELALVGEPHELEALAAVAWADLRPDLVIAAGPEGTSEPPLMAGRALVYGQPAAYVCHGFTCRMPVTTPEALRAELGQEVHS